jgi:hypothetical protein
MLHKPITLFQVLALYTAHTWLNSEIIAAYVYGWMSN